MRANLPPAGCLLIIAVLSAGCSRSTPQQVVPGHFWVEVDQGEEIFFTNRGGIVIKHAKAGSISGAYRFADPRTIDIELQSVAGETYKMTWLATAGGDDLTLTCVKDGGYRHKRSGTITRYRKEF